MATCEIPEEMRELLDVEPLADDVKAIATSLFVRAYTPAASRKAGHMAKWAIEAAQSFCDECDSRGK